MTSLSSSINTDYTLYASYTPDKLRQEYLRVCGDLAEAQLQLSDAMQDESREWVMYYRNSSEPSASGREKEARIMTIELTTEVIKLRGEIFAIKEQKSILEFLLNNGSAT